MLLWNIHRGCGSMSLERIYCYTTEIPSQPTASPVKSADVTKSVSLRDCYCGSGMDSVGC